VGWGTETEGKGKTDRLGYKQFNRRAKEKKIVTRILIRTYRTHLSHHPMLSLLLSSKSPYSRQLPT